MEGAKKLTRSSWVLVILITLFGAFLRFYKLDWGGSYFFHPDEYHIASAASRLDFPTQMNPELFSYGSFTVYLIYFSKLLLSGIFKDVNFHPILVGRFYSAMFSTLTVALAYLLSKELFKPKQYAYLSALFIAVTPGLIQQAHYATPESTLTFWLLLTLLLWVKWLDKQNLKLLLASGGTLGVALGTKIVAITFLPILILLPFINLKSISLKKLIKQFKYVFPLLLITVLAFILVFPFSLIDNRGFIHSMNYETSVSAGKSLVFYTRQFTNTLPVIFQLKKVLPYALGPAMLIGGIAGVLLMGIGIFKSFFIKTGPFNRKLAVFLLAFLALFVPNSLLFTKWTRFLAPSFSFFGLFTAYFIYSANKKRKRFFLLSPGPLAFIFLITTFFWTAMFFSIYRKEDVRLTATNWVNKNIPPKTFILTEGGNTLEVPLSGDFRKLPFDFYKLDENDKLRDELPTLILSSDYFIIQSRRIFSNHQRLPEEYPTTALFYEKLFSDELGFAKIKEFNSFPSLEFGNWNLEIGDEIAEETWSVFDHPVVRIYKKVNPLSLEGYRTLLQI